MESYHPIQCYKCRRFLGYADRDFEDTAELTICVWCKYCMNLKPVEKLN